MRSDWDTKHDKIKKMGKTGFKAHQSFATMLIQQYAIKRFREHKKKEKIDPTQFNKFAYVDGPSKKKSTNAAAQNSINENTVEASQERPLLDDTKQSGETFFKAGQVEGGKKGYVGLVVVDEAAEQSQHINMPMPDLGNSSPPNND